MRLTGALASGSWRSVKAWKNVSTAPSLTDFSYSGKSSVLEGLTDLPFPRDSGLRTRFATQITFRRTTTTKIAVSIIPAANAESAHAKKLRAA